MNCFRLNYKIWFSYVILLVSVSYATPTLASPVNIIAAENFYGELAQEIGGTDVSVVSILSNPDADPHLFTTSPSTSKLISTAQIIIYNGADYDPWMNQLLKLVNKNKIVIINVADLIKAKPGSNPHIWYEKNTFPQLAKLLAHEITALDSSSQFKIAQNLNQFLNNNQKVGQRIEQIKAKYSGTPVTATEPVFGYMAYNLGLQMLGLVFQWKIMNETEPSPKMLADYQNLFIQHKVNLLFYNRQVVDSATKNILDLAGKNNITVVGVTETMPSKQTVNDWLLAEINLTESALAKSMQLKAKRKQ